jgi:heavy metal sensor kinase
LIVLGAGIWFALRYELYVSLDHSLAASADGLSQYLQRESHGDNLPDVLEEAREYASGLPQGYRLRIFAADGTLVLALPNTGLSTETFQKSTDILARGHRLKVEFSAPVESIDLTLAALRNILLACIPIVFIVASLGGWWLSRTALAPVDRMTATAESIGMHDLSARLLIPKTGDELERLGEAWNRMLERLATSVDKMKRFTADAAHELRTPVSIIRSTAELALRRDRDAAAYRMALVTVGEESVHLSALVADLLWLARNDAESIKYNFEDVRVTEILDRVLPSIGPLASARQITVRTEINLDSTHIANVDRSALRRVIMVLLDNAIKFTPSGTTVLLRAFVRDRFCILEVRDEGPGITLEDLPRIFDRFYTCDRSRNTSGFGLGLSIAKAIVEAHGGHIEVHTVEGKGSSFEVILPLNRSRIFAREFAAEQA